MATCDKISLVVIFVAGLVPGVTCNYNYNVAGLVVSSLIAILCLTAAVFLGIFACYWRDWNMKRQNRRGRRRIPRDEYLGRGLFGKKVIVGQEVQQYKPKILMEEAPIVVKEVQPGRRSPQRFSQTPTYVIDRSPSPVQQPKPILVHSNQTSANVQTTYVPINSRNTEIRTKQTAQKVVSHAPIHVHAATINQTTSGPEAFISNPQTTQATYQNYYEEDDQFIDAVVNFGDDEDVVTGATTDLTQTQSGSQTKVLY